MRNQDQMEKREKRRSVIVMFSLSVVGAVLFSIGLGFIILGFINNGNSHMSSAGRTFNKISSSGIVVDAVRIPRKTGIPSSSSDSNYAYIIEQAQHQQDQRQGQDNNDNDNGFCDETNTMPMVMFMDGFRSSLFVDKRNIDTTNDDSRIENIYETTAMSTGRIINAASSRRRIEAATTTKHSNMKIEEDDSHAGTHQKPPCLLYYFNTWKLLGIDKFHGAIFFSIMISILTELISSLHTKVVFSRCLQRHKSIRKMMLSILYVLQQFMGYIIMLGAMMYSIEIFIATIIGLVVGHLLFSSVTTRRRTTKNGNTSCSADRDDNSRNARNNNTNIENGSQ